ncbi:MAG: hypothetical protein AB7I50_20435 [Vicinamibacterales bacterium]
MRSHSLVLFSVVALAVSGVALANEPGPSTSGQTAAGSLVRL